MRKRINIQNEAYKQPSGQYDFIKTPNSPGTKLPNLLNKISLLLCLWLSGVAFGYAWAMLHNGCDFLVKMFNLF